MKSFQSVLLLLAVTICVVHDHQCSAFTTPTLLSSTTTSQSTVSTQLNMGLFDRFTQSPEERAAAEAEREQVKQAKAKAKRLEQQEQLRLQKEIIDRRRNPEKMDEYHALKQERRNLRLEGDDEGAANLAAKIFENVDDTAQSVSFAKSTATPTSAAADTSATTTATTTKSEDAEEEVDLKSEYSKEMLKKYKLM